MASFLVLGDSIATTFAGEAAPTWAELVAAQTGWTRLNQPVPATALAAAVPGSTLLRSSPAQGSPAAVESFWQRAGGFSPDVLLIALGVNDYGNANPSWNLDIWEAAWFTLYAQVNRMATRPRVYVVGMPLIFWDTNGDPLVGGPGLQTPRGYAQWAATKDEAVAAMSTVAWYRAFRARAYYIEVASHMDMTCYTQTNGVWNIHPNAEGHRRIAAQVLGAVA